MSEQPDAPSTRWRPRLSVDWIAVIVAGIFAVLAALNVLPEMPWATIQIR